jgi:hypothetical protein
MRWAPRVSSGGNEARGGPQAITAGEDDDILGDRPKSRFPGASPCATGQRQWLSPLNEGGRRRTKSPAAVVEQQGPFTGGLAKQAENTIACGTPGENPVHPDDRAHILADDGIGAWTRGASGTRRSARSLVEGAGNFQPPGRGCAAGSRRRACGQPAACRGFDGLIARMA